MFQILNSRTPTEDCPYRCNCMLYTIRKYIPALNLHTYVLQHFGTSCTAIALLNPQIHATTTPQKHIEAT